MPEERVNINADSFPVIILTGLSGAGKSTVLNVFEDMQFFCLDGIPLEIVPRIVSQLTPESLARYKGLIIGVELGQNYLPKDFSRMFDEIHHQAEGVKLLFIDASNQVIMRRYATTRRPHPLGIEGLGLEQAIATERERLYIFKDMADLIIDTSEFSIHDLRRHIQQQYACFFESVSHFRVHLVSFGFKYGQPSEADMMYDLRFLPNPYFVDELRPLSGLDASISDYVLKSKACQIFLPLLNNFFDSLLPLFEAEGRYRLTIGFGCTGGRHRSVAIAEAVGRHLKTLGYAVSIEHRHLELG